jgi:hypothetical protein
MRKALSLAASLYFMLSPVSFAQDTKTNIKTTTKELYPSFVVYESILIKKDTYHMTREEVDFNQHPYNSLNKKEFNKKYLPSLRAALINEGKRCSFNKDAKKAYKLLSN